MPIICKPPEPEAIIKTNTEFDVTPIYQPKPFKAISRPETIKQTKSHLIKKTLKKTPAQSKPIPKTETIPIPAKIPSKTPTKPKIQIEQPENKPKDPAIEQEKIKKLKEIVKQGLEKHKSLKKIELDLKEKQELEKKKKFDLIEGMKLKAKDALKETKMKTYEPTGRWGADERNFKEMSEKEKEKIKNERLAQEKAKKEYREKVRKEGRARIGLEIIDLYPEAIKVRQKSDENLVTQKPRRENSKEIQLWIKKKRLMNQEIKMQQEMIENKKFEQKLEVLQKLEMMSKPKKQPQPSKNKEIINKIKKKTEKMRKNKLRSGSLNQSRGYFEDSRTEFKGNYEFIVDENDFNLSLGKRNSEILDIDDKDNKKYRDNRKSDLKPTLKLDILDTFEEIKNESKEKVSEDYENEEFESQSFQGAHSRSLQSSKAHEDEESLENEQEEYYSEEESYDSSDCNQLGGSNKELRIIGNESDERIQDDSYDGDSQYGEDNFVETHQGINHPAPGKACDQESYPGNGQISPEYEKYVLNPYTAKDKNPKFPYALSQPQPILKFPVPEEETKEKMRTKLSDLQKRVSLSKTPENPSKAAEKFEKIQVSDDLDIKFYNIPGIIATEQTYALSKIASEVEIYKAASKIQSIVRGYLTRKNLIRIKHNIPSNAQISKDIHGLLLKHYPEAYVPDFYSSNYIPESISMSKKTIPVKTISINTDPVHTNHLIRLEPYEDDEYNLINVLVKENLLLNPETSIENQSYRTDEVYSEEFESISEDVQSETSKIRSLKASSSIKESISASKYEKTSRSRAFNRSIKESIDEYDPSESIKESFLPSQQYKNKFSGSIQESIPESSKNQSIQESIEETGNKKTFSGSYYQSKKSEILEEIEEMKQTTSAKLINEEINEEYTSRSRNTFKQSGTDVYEDDFEESSSVPVVAKTNFALKPSLNEPVLSKIQGFSSAKQLEDKLMSGLDALDRARAREYELDAIISQKKIILQEEIKKQTEIALNKQENYLNLVNKTKEQDFGQFQVFMQEIMRQQKECFNEITQAITSSLQNIPIIVQERSNLDKIPLEEYKIPIVSSKTYTKPQENIIQGTGHTKTLQSSAISPNPYVQPLQTLNIKENSDKKGYKTPAKPKEIESSSERSIKESIEIVSESLSSKSINTDREKSEKNSSSDSSHQATIKKTPESIIKESEQSEIESSYEPVITSPLGSESQKDSKIKFPQESVEELYESEFESYHESELSLRIKKQDSSKAIYISEDSEASLKSKLQLPINSIPDPESRFSHHQSSEFSESLQEEIQENIQSEGFESERSEKPNKSPNISVSSKNSSNYRSNPLNFETKYPHAESLSSSLSSPHKVSARSNRKSPDLKSSTSSIPEDIDIYDSFSKQSANFENSIRKSGSLADSKAKENPSESLQSEDPESEKSFKPSYSSDFESISQSDTKNLKAFQLSIKEVSPEESNSEVISESLHETENGYSADFESESQSKKLKTARSESKDLESAEKKNSLDNIPEENKSVDNENALVDEIIFYLLETLKDDASLLMSDKLDVDELVEELCRGIVNDGLKLVPNQKVFVNNSSHVARTIDKFTHALPDEESPVSPLEVLESYQTEHKIKPKKHKNYSEWVPSSSKEAKDSFRAFNKSIKDCIDQIHASNPSSLLNPTNQKITKKDVKEKLEEWNSFQMGSTKSCVTQEEKRQLAIQRENSMLKVLYSEIKEEEQDNTKTEKFEFKVAIELEKGILNMFCEEIQTILSL